MAVETGDTSREKGEALFGLKFRHLSGSLQLFELFFSFRSTEKGRESSLPFQGEPII